MVLIPMVLEVLQSIKAASTLQSQKRVCPQTFTSGSIHSSNYTESSAKELT
jgi:hypothetical protein